MVGGSEWPPGRNKLKDIYPNTSECVEIQEPDNPGSVSMSSPKMHLFLVSLRWEVIL